MQKRISIFLSYLLTLSAVAFSSYAQPNTGVIQGTVTTADGKHAQYVNIGLQGTAKGAVADSRGGYRIQNVTPGSYTLTASYIGLKTQEKIIEVKAGETITVNFTLEENARELQEVIVSGRVDYNKVDLYVAKVPLKNLENPQVYHNVPSEIIKQQAITSYDDIFRNIPGIFRTWESTGRNGDGAAYFALRGLEGQAALLNGLPGITNGNLDPANVEEVQVLKGPSATLFGANATAYSSYGGLINTITKKPYSTWGGEIGYYVGSFGLNRITADVNAPLANANDIALRVNTAYHSEGSFQDSGFKKSFFLAPTLAYQVNDRLRFLIVTEFLQEERAAPPVFFHSNRSEPLTYRSIDELDLNNNLSFTSNDLTIKNPRTTIQAQMTYQLMDNWTSQTVISRGTADSEGYYTYLWPDIEGDNYFGQYFTYVNEDRTATNIQQNFTGDFKVGNMRNRLVFGLDYFNKQAVNNGLGYVSIRNVTPQGDVNYVDVYSGDTLAPVYLSKASIDERLSETAPANSKITNTSYSAYISDVFNLTPSVSILAGLRADYFDSGAEISDPDDDFTQFALSPKFGVVYQPVLDKVSLFANYQNGFYNVAPVQVADPDGSNPRFKSFEPERANQWEVGVKTNLFQDRVFATFSYYDIKISNKVIGDVNNFYNQIQGGEIESKGYEVDITSSPFPGLNLIAGYSHNETKNLKGNEGDFYAEPGRAPGGQGPEEQFNCWATYEIVEGKLRNFGVGLGLNYAGEYSVIDNSVTGVFNLPAYTVMNASLFYNSDKLRLTLNINNLTDTEYYIGYWSVNPQKPRNAVMSMAYKF